MSAHGEDEQSYRGMTGMGKQYKIELYDQSLKPLKQTVTFIKKLILDDIKRESWIN